MPSSTVRGMEVFVVRVWTSADSRDRDAGDGIRGRVEHVTSGRRQPFHGLEELGGLIDEHLRSAIADGPDSGWPETRKE